MPDSALRQAVVSALLQAGGPLSLDRLAQELRASRADLLPLLEELSENDQVLRSEFLPGEPRPQFCWWACWTRELERRTAQAKQRLRELIGPPESEEERHPGLESAPAQAFFGFVINEYHPPEDKRFLVFFQCSVRRPFSSSPSHASMRRAIEAAVGYDPALDFLRCPVHVVVLASRLGPVPYELEDVFPANVRSGGVKHFSDEHYAYARPILSDRMAAYLTQHRGAYDHVATFTEGRYADVMRATARMAEVEFPILPRRGGAEVVRMGSSRPRTYWARYWIQLYLEITRTLDKSRRARAEERLRGLKVQCELDEASPGAQGSHT